MSVLASKLTGAMTTSNHDLVVFDRIADRWQHYSWGDVHTRATAVAARIRDDDAGDVGVVGEPTVDVVAAVIGALLAGVAVSVLPDMVRGADPPQWAETTVRRFAGIGVGTVFSHGAELQLLRAAQYPTAVLDAAEVAGTESRVPVIPQAAKAAVLQGTAGSTGTPRTAVLSPEAVYANLRGLTQRLGVDAATDVGCS